MQPQPWLLHGLLPDHGVLGAVANVGLNVAIILDALAGVLLFDGDLDTRSKVAWLSAILLLPIIGAIVFLIQRYRRPASVGA